MRKLLYFIVLSCIVQGCSNSNDISSQWRVITLNTDDVVEQIDLSLMLEDSVDIISLEINEHCMASAKDVKLVTDNYIFVSNKSSKKLSIFDRTGKFLRTVGSIGQGPGEYISLGDFTTVGDSIYLQDAQKDKIIIYPIIGEGYREINIDPPIYYSELTSSGNNLYLISNYSCSGDHYNNLFRINSNNTSRREFIPYDKEICENSLSWGLTKHSGQYRDTTLLVFSINDTIYNLANDNVFKQYVVNFPKNKMPANLLSQNGVEILSTAIKKGYNTGIDKIFNTHNYIIGDFGVGDKIYNFIFRKDSGSVVLSESLVMKNFGGLPVNDYITTDNNEFIALYNPSMLKQIWEHMISDKQFTNEMYKAKLKEIVENLNDEDNPVILKLKFKLRSELTTDM